MKTLREYVTTSPCPRSRWRAATSIRRARSSSRDPNSASVSSSERDFPCSARARARRSLCALAWDITASLLRYPAMKVVALAGGIGAGKFLRGLTRLVRGQDLTVIVNVADDVIVHGLHISPDPDSVTYWLGDEFDRERGWGR